MKPALAKSAKRRRGASSGVPKWWHVAPAVGHVTFTEILRDKVLYNVILCAFLLFGAGLLSARLNFLDPGRIVLDMGQSAVSISCVMIAVFLGGALLGKEIERRTIHVALSRPISRSQFVFGKYLGIAGVIALNWFLLSIVFLGLLALMGGDGASNSHSTLAAALLLSLMQSLVMASIAIFFSSFTTTSLAVILSIGIFLVGHNITELRAVVAKLAEPGLVAAAGVGVDVLPDLEYFNLGFKLTYGLPAGGLFVLESLAYGLFLIAVFLASASFFMHKKEI